MQRDDAALAFDIVYAGQRINRFIDGLTLETFDENQMAQSAVIRECMVTGEAIRLLSDEFKFTHPEIPWSNWVGFRNRLVHAYFNISLNINWEAIKDDLNLLIDIVRQHIPPDEPDDNSPDAAHTTT